MWNKTTIKQYVLLFWRKNRSFFIHNRYKITKIALIPLIILEYKRMLKCELRSKKPIREISNFQPIRSMLPQHTFPINGLGLNNCRISRRTQLKRTKHFWNSKIFLSLHFISVCYWKKRDTRASIRIKRDIYPNGKIPDTTFSYVLFCVHVSK